MGRLTQRASMALGASVFIAVLVAAPHLQAARASAAEPPREFVAVALEGDPAPGGGSFSGCDPSNNNTVFDEPFVNKLGDVVFAAGFTGGGCGIFLSHNDSLSAIARSGQTVAGVGTLGAATPPDCCGDLFSNSGAFDGPHLNNKGTVVFVNKNISGSTSAAVFRKKLDEPLEVLAKAGDPAPGFTSGFTFKGFDDLAVNNKDDVSFIAIIDDGSCDNSDCPSAIYLLENKSNTLSVIAKSGDILPAPGSPDGTFHIGDCLADGPWMNDKKAVAFKVDCADPSNGEIPPSDSTWLKPFNKPIKPLIVTGSPAPGSFTNFVISDVDPGRPSLNNKGVFAAGLVLRPTSVSAEDGCFSADPTPCRFAVVTAKAGHEPKICAKSGDAVPTGGTLSNEFDFGDVTINQKGLVTFNIEIDGVSTSQDFGNFVCKKGKLRAVAIEGDDAPGGLLVGGGSMEGMSQSDAGKITFAALHESFPANKSAVLVTKGKLK